MAISPSPTIAKEFVAPTGLAAILGVAAGQAAGLRGVPDGFSSPIFEPGYVVETRGCTLVIVSYVSMALTLVVAMARIVTRYLYAKRLRSDDWMIILATSFCVALTAENVHGGVNGGLGKHGWDLKYSEIAVGVKMLVPHLLFYAFTLIFVKFSIILFVRDLANQADSRTLQHVITFYLIFHIFWVLAFAFACIFQCLPVQASFSLSLRFHPDTRCRDNTVFFWVSSSVHMVSDIAILALPIWMVVGLQMTWQKKAAVVFMFSLGGLACLCSIIRMAYLGDYTSSFDISWDGYLPCIWGQLEATISIITASLPALKILFARVIPGLLGAQGSNGRGNVNVLQLRPRRRARISDIFRRSEDGNETVQRKLSKPRMAMPVINESASASITTMDTAESSAPIGIVRKWSSFSSRRELITAPAPTLSPDLERQ